MKDDCASISPLLDAYWSEELAPLDRARVDAHVETCPDCAREAETGRKVKSALSAALREDVPIDALRDRILGAIEPVPASPPASGWRWLTPLAAGLVAGAAVAFALTSSSSDERDTAIYSDSLLSHAACAVMRPFPAARTREEAATRLGSYRSVLDEIPLEGEGRELVDAHICPSVGREFGHVILRVDGEIVSILVTEKSRGALPPGDGTTRAGTVEVRTVKFPIFDLAGFESERHLGFVVTPRPALEGEEVASRLVPATFRALGDLDASR